MRAGTRTKTPISKEIVDLFKHRDADRVQLVRDLDVLRNELRRPLYAQAEDADAVAMTSRSLLARIEGTRWDFGRPLDEPRHPDIDDSHLWTRVFVA